MASRVFELPEADFEDAFRRLLGSLLPIDREDSIMGLVNDGLDDLIVGFTFYSVYYYLWFLIIQRTYGRVFYPLLQYLAPSSLNLRAYQPPNFPKLQI